ncbi:uncharacterized protein LOC113291595 [Papaver somniferum]|uniref:uncharacterized protein LOC113291595 n=1 Tax=Papaver somniferum TaxID=3469 RepID=UPI000E6FFE02|nr:uncharacterized protein LOC113291595 [Papaver somniferum]
MLHEDVPGEFPEILVTKEETWLLYFDRSVTHRNDTGGAGVVLVSPSGDVFSHSFKMDFHCTNNSAEYEAFLLGLSLAKEAGETHLEIRGDSKLLVNQMNGAHSLREIILAPFRSEAQRILTHFADATIVHIGEPTTGMLIVWQLSLPNYNSREKSQNRGALCHLLVLLKSKTFKRTIGGSLLFMN